MLTHLFATIITIAFGAVTGLAELRAADVQRPATLLFCFACLLGAAYPDGAWRRALMLGLSVPLAQWVASVAGEPLPFALPDYAAGFLALLPAAAGTMLGVALRRAYAAHHATHRDEPRI